MSMTAEVARQSRRANERRYRATAKGTEVQRLAQARYHQTPEWKEKNRLKSKATAFAHQAYTAAIKLAAGCIDCGSREAPARLHFDHRPGEVKLFNVGSMGGMRRERVDAEIAKCDVRCVACHCARHHLDSET